MLSFLVQVATLASLATLSLADDAPVNDLEAYNKGFLGQFPSQEFKSSDVVAPVFQISTFNPNLVDDSGFLFLTMEHGDKSGPAIFSSKDLSLVYADISYAKTFDARAQVKSGGKYLTFIEGGRCHAFDANYQKKWTVEIENLGPTQGSIHEFEITTQGGTALMTAVQDVRYNLTALGGEMDGWLSDSIFQEVELETNRVTNVWRSFTHVNLTDTMVKYSPKKTFMHGDGFDWFHIDSVSKTSKGHYLVSSRSLSAIILLQADSLNPRWVLGGKRNQFKDLSGGNATNFANQYDAKFVQGNESQISFFDNQATTSGSCSGENCSRGVVVELDYEEMTVRLLHEFYHPREISSGSGGSVQGLDNGNFLVGWGANPAITEHTSNGTVVMDIQRGVIPHETNGDPDLDISVYRAWKMEWIGRPPWGPSIASALPGNEATNATIYVSWNGDTQVDQWEVYVGEDDKNATSSPRLLANSSRFGFETEILLETLPLPRSARAVGSLIDLQGSRNVCAYTPGALSGASKTEDQQQDKTAKKGEQESGENTVEKELGPLARRLEEATEEALFTGGRAGRRAVEDAGFSEELKERLLNKIADANFKSENASAFAEASLSSTAGEGTRHIASAQAWTGEESTADTVLRMLDDAKKPLAPGLRGKFQPPPVDMRLQKQPRRSAGEKVAKARDKVNTYVGMGGQQAKNGMSEDEKEAWRKELRERFEPGARALPNSITGLAALANERIENAIARGQFKNIPRGKGVERDARADNPFIDTTEYIMNKMIQRQDIVPPWIEKQQELAKQLGIFRARLRNDWRRFAARMIASRGGSLQEQIRRAEEYAAAEEVHNPIIRKKTDGQVEEIKAASPVVGRPFRDSAWEQTEAAYHKLSIERLNALTRSYNLMAPDLAKKPYFSLERELKACFAEVAPTVAREIQERATGGTARSLGGGGQAGKQTGLLETLTGGDDVKVHVEAQEKAYGLKEWWRDVWKKN
ncbi:ASST-domain-containing protein [Fusarium oxysporum Fo47]|uniref:ASST-domain-containing protein n=1 Tax=Fusarium oxysporum Fo47 TaxID=660027 RepID=UPI002869D0DD|nr:ASST-domain-containing protein [Fusarium oxysporum Fo47]QKD58620.2 ASST-domain-containing protein [Fusarium oxysporum Fo47]